jgi:hypothetical protein
MFLIFCLRTSKNFDKIQSMVNFFQFKERYINIEPAKLIKSTFYAQICLKESAEKHFKGRSEDIAKHIVETIKDENLSHEYQDKGCSPNFQVASQTVISSVPNPGMRTQFRNMSYRLHPDERVIEIFHLSPWRKDQYDQCPLDMKKRS